MTQVDPFSDVKKELALHLSAALGVDATQVMEGIEIPPSEELGDLAVPLRELVPKGSHLELQFKGKLIKSTKIIGIYLNAFVNEDELFRLTFSNMTEDYGILRTSSPLRIVVEHTSANPVHPLHIGHLRNAILGDTLARLLKLRGHEVNVRFYVNDAGRQSAILSYGMSRLGWPDPPIESKKDVWLGLVYACTNVLIEINKLKKVLEELKEKHEEYLSKVRELDEFVAVAKELRDKGQEIFDKLADEIGRDPDPEGSVQKLMQQYERGEEPIRTLMRKVSTYALEGISQTLSFLGIYFDSFDYEGDLLWNGSVEKIINEAREKGILTIHKGASAVSFQGLTEEERRALRIPKGYDVPPLILVRADGTTLYPTRDIAYTLKKYKEFSAHRVINVIAEEQSTPQTQLRATLYLMGFRNEAVNLLHYSYGMVNVEGMRMSGRRGRYISVDDIIDQVRAVVGNRVKSRGGNENVIDELTKGAIRFAIISVAPTKPMSFSIQRAIDFNQNSGPYLQYTYARAHSIVSKMESMPSVEKADTSELVGDKRRLLLQVAKFPEVFVSTTEQLKPEIMATYLNKLADIFNRWYDSERILQEPAEGKRALKLWLAMGVKTVIGNGLSALGINPLSRI